MKARGFTIIELVIAITISAIVLVFAAMFIGAPLGAYEAQSRRAELVGDASAAWPRIERDLRAALPNSLRARRNGNFVVLEMLAVEGVARYMAPPSASFTTAGRLPVLTSSRRFLWVNNAAAADADPYSAPGLMTPAGTTITIADGASGESQVTTTPAAAFAVDSPRHRIYLLAGPVTYLCDEGQGTLRRYEGYTIAANQTARDTPAELTTAGATVALVTQGLTGCNFAASARNTTQSQTAAVRLTTTRNGDVVTLLHSSRAEYVP
jgi:MSHA biogenesis protein MshO